MVQRYEQLLNAARKMEKISPLFLRGRIKSSIFAPISAIQADNTSETITN